MPKVKRVYARPEKSDGIRILVDRLWPRGLTKQKAHIDKWIKEIAPSDDLRKWFAHKEERWEGFKIGYIKELKDKKELVKQLRKLAEKQNITLLYAAKDKNRNNAVMLSEFVKNK